MELPMDQQEYITIHEMNKLLIQDIEGETLRNISIHVVSPEINIVFLHFDEFDVEIFGAFGSEILKIEIAIRRDTFPTVELPQLNMFRNQRINQIRIIGEAWNGYGFEVSFDGIFDRTLIIQSIYSGDKPEGLEDCLRIGIGHYVYFLEDKL